MCAFRRALSNLGHELAHSTICRPIEAQRHRACAGTNPENYLERVSITPALGSRLARSRLLYGGDFGPGKGLWRYMVLFFIEISTRRVQIAGIARDCEWVVDEIRSPANLTDAVDRTAQGQLAECSITMSGLRDQMPAHFSFHHITRYFCLRPKLVELARRAGPRAGNRDAIR